MQRVLVISPGVLPLPPVLGGAVENLISRLHSLAVAHFEIEYVSVQPPSHKLQNAKGLEGAVIHYIDSINPLKDFTFDNQFELHESAGWQAYHDFCVNVAASRQPQIIHVHNEAHLLPALRQVAPNAKLLLHVNDEVVTRMQADELTRLAKACDMILACSRHIGKEISNAFNAANLSCPPIEIFYNFVDLKEYDPELISPLTTSDISKQLNLDKGPVVLFVGRMIEQKGPHLLLRAFRRAIETCPDAQLVFVGSPWYSRANESPFIDFIREEAVPIAEKIRFTGYVDHTMMPLYYQLANVVAVPSIWNDPSPFVAYESQAMGKPVVASTRGGIPEIVEDRVTGRCIDVFNTILFAKILSDWLTNPVEAREFGIRGRQRVSENFEIEKAGNQLLNIYRRLSY